MRITRLPALALALLVLLSACSSVPVPGSWKVPWEQGSTENEVGMIFFGVSDDSSTITSFDILPLSWQCGDMVLGNTNFFFLAGEDDAYEVSEILPGFVSGDLSPIENGSFSFTLQVMAFKNSIFDLNIGTFTFAGQFTAAKKANGTWALDLPASGDTCQGTWNAIPNDAGDD